VRNTTVLTSVSRNELIHTVHDRQLHFLGHMLRNTRSPHASIYALYQPTHGTTRRGRPRLNCVDYIDRLTGMRTDELFVEVSQDREAWREHLWSRALIHNHPTRETERERDQVTDLSCSHVDVKRNITYTTKLRNQEPTAVGYTDAANIILSLM